MTKPYISRRTFLHNANWLVLIDRSLGSLLPTKKLRRKLKAASEHFRYFQIVNNGKKTLITPRIVTYRNVLKNKTEKKNEPIEHYIEDTRITGSIKLESFEHLSDNIFRIVENISPQALVIDGVVTNTFNRIPNHEGLVRHGDFSASAQNHKYFVYCGDIELADIKAIISDGALVYHKIENAIVENAIRGLVINKSSVVRNVCIRNTYIDGIKIKNGAAGTAILDCKTQNTGSHDHGETIVNFGHGISIEDGSYIFRHIARQCAEDCFQIGVDENEDQISGKVELIECRGYLAKEDLIDVKDTGEKLSIVGFRGKQSFDTAINIHPKKGSGDIEIHDSKFCDVRQMLRCRSDSMECKIQSARNLYDARSGFLSVVTSCLALDQGVSKFESFADVFIGGAAGDSSSVNRATISVDCGRIRMFNPTIYRPSEESNSGSAIHVKNLAESVEIFNAIIVTDKKNRILTVDGDVPVIVRNALLWCCCKGSEYSKMLMIDGREFSEAEIASPSYGGVGNLIYGSLALHNIIIADPEFKDDKSKVINLRPQAALAYRGDPKFAPVKDIDGMAYEYLPWLDKVGPKNGKYCMLGAYSKFW